MMMRGFAYFVLLGLTGLCSAQNKPVSPDLAKLTFLLGKWTSVEHSVGPGGKKVDFILKGSNGWTLGGQFLKIEEFFEIPDFGKIENFILMGYDPKTKSYRAWWYTNNTPLPFAFVGYWQAHKLVLSSIKEGGRPELRIIYDPKEDGHYLARLEVQREGKWIFQTEAEYTRSK